MIVRGLLGFLRWATAPREVSYAGLLLLMAGGAAVHAAEWVVSGILGAAYIALDIVQQPRWRRAKSDAEKLRLKRLEAVLERASRPTEQARPPNTGIVGQGHGEPGERRN